MKTLKHIVMWRLQDFAEGRSKAENARWMKEHLEALVGQIPELLSAEVGINIKESEASYDAVLTATFRSLAELETYTNQRLLQENQAFAHRGRLLGGKITQICGTHILFCYLCRLIQKFNLKIITL